MSNGEKESLSLRGELDGLRYVVKSDGSHYSVREDRRRYFFPMEWIKFINLIDNKQHKFFFLTLLHTGARVMEALNLKHEDINMERSTITFHTTKGKATKRTYGVTGKSRSFFVSSGFVKAYNQFIRGKKINPTKYIFLSNEKLPDNYSSLKNSEKKRYYQSASNSYGIMLKRKLKLAGIKDAHNFSPHNIRKTYGMWGRVFNIENMELCYRMGHDLNTFMAHYGSSLMFTDDERRLIEKIMGDVK